MTQRRVAELEAEPRPARQGIQRPKADGWTAMWRGYSRPSPSRRSPRTSTAVGAPAARAIAQSITRFAAGLQAAPEDRAPARAAREMGGPADADRLGHGRAARVRLAALPGPSTCASPARTARAARSATATRSSPTDQRTEHVPLGSCTPIRAGAGSTTRRSPRRASWASSSATRSTTPTRSCMWEAQFGDFANGAQVIIDQFITSSEDKWKRFSGLVLLLPHGYEGQGPEHSSARLERYLQSCAEHNIQVAQPTTPAQMFHLLRASGAAPRAQAADRDDAEEPAAPAGGDVAARRARRRGTFHRVLPRRRRADPAKVTRVLMCTGKIYLRARRERARRKDDDVAIVRIEKLYPSGGDLVAALDSHSASAECSGCRTSRATWARATSSRRGSSSAARPRRASAAACDASRAPRARARRPARTRRTSSSSSRSAGRVRPAAARTSIPWRMRAHGGSGRSAARRIDLRGVVAQVAQAESATRSPTTSRSPSSRPTRSRCSCRRRRRRAGRAALRR